MLKMWRWLANRFVYRSSAEKTGHYARTRPGPSEDWDNPLLTLCEDRNKDQTYFLSAVPRSALSKVHKTALR